MLLMMLSRHSVPIVEQQPHSFSRAGVGHAEMHQKHQTWIWGVDQAHLQVERLPQQHLQGLVVLWVVAAILCIWSERKCYFSDVLEACIEILDV